MKSGWASTETEILSLHGALQGEDHRPGKIILP